MSDESDKEKEEIKKLKAKLIAEYPIPDADEIKTDEKVVKFPGKTTIEPVEIEIENMTSVVAKKIDWIWKDKIATGKITLFAGEPGVGKSQLLLYIASVLSKGDKFHFENKKCDESKVLLISGEDNADDTVKPRLMALNAKIENIDYVKGVKKVDRSGSLYYDVICLIESLESLQKKIKENKYKVIIVDPISVYLGSIDENKNKEIRAALSMLGALAERNDCAFVINSHFSKPSGNSQKNAIYRVMGSIGFAAAARIVYGIMKDPEDTERRLFLPIKNNIGQDKYGLVYRIKPFIVDNVIETSYVEWIDEKIDKTANDVLNPSVIKSPRLEEAKEFLQELLKFGSVSLSEIREKAKQEGFSIDRLYAAKNELKIYESISIDRKRGKIWSLPS